MSLELRILRRLESPNKSRGDHDGKDLTIIRISRFMEAP